MPQYIPTDTPLAIAVTAAIQKGDVETLSQLLTENAGLATARLGKNTPGKGSRTLLHILTDWPANFPNGAKTAEILIQGGADVNASFNGKHQETPLHWAASSDDVAVLDVLVAAGADIEAKGAVIAGGTPMADATAFAQWKAAFRLLEYGAKTNLFEASTLGLMERIQPYFDGAPPEQLEINAALWGACHGGRQAAAEFILSQGAQINWVPRWEELTPLDVAIRNRNGGLVEWLKARGAKRFAEM